MLHFFGSFGLFDFNADGFISLTEFTTYLASVFKTMFMLQPETQAEIGASPEELAKVTAEECFAEADINLDGYFDFLNPPIPSSLLFLSLRPRLPTSLLSLFRRAPVISRE